MHLSVIQQRVHFLRKGNLCVNMKACWLMWYHACAFANIGKSGKSVAFKFILVLMILVHVVGKWDLNVKYTLVTILVLFYTIA